MTKPEPICIGGLPILPLTRLEWAHRIIEIAQARKTAGKIPAFFTSANGNVLSRAARDPLFKDILLSSDGIDADGQPLVLSSWFLPISLPERCSTTDLMPVLAEVGQEKGISFYFLGAHESENATAVEALQRAYPKLKIAGRRNGYFSRSEETSVVEHIRNARPDILLIGMGVPLEQQFVMRNRSKLVGVGAIKTCGGLIDRLAGRIRRPPPWIQQAGLEWLIRMCSDPRRFFWRYAITSPHALYLLLTKTRQRWTEPD
jgi:N-acetylglucosaminyldiphosphoundecaprenol N-acetyl-beta-D-mannosaminyltransferase